MLGPRVLTKQTGSDLGLNAGGCTGELLRTPGASRGLYPPRTPNQPLGNLRDQSREAQGRASSPFPSFFLPEGLGRRRMPSPPGEYRAMKSTRGQWLCPAHVAPLKPLEHTSTALHFHHVFSSAARPYVQCLYKEQLTLGLNLAPD